MQKKIPKRLSLKQKSFLGLLLIISLGLFLYLDGNFLKTYPGTVQLLAKQFLTSNQKASDLAVANQIYNDIVNKVLPSKFSSRIALKNSIVKLSNAGVIDKNKFENLYQNRGGFPPGFENVLSQTLDSPMVLDKQNANFYLNLLWPLGLSNYMDANKDSPLNGENLNNYASTGGWNLGREKNGGVYFNKFKIITLTPEQETMVLRIAKNTYRPCCNNSTFFQDCNHGSALLGLLELGASEGLSENELYQEALAFNSFWFPDNYIETALYFRIVEKIDWDRVDPKTVLSSDYSSATGWSKNIHSEIAKIPNLIPKQENGQSCGV